MRPLITIKDPAHNDDEARLQRMSRDNPKQRIALHSPQRLRVAANEFVDLLLNKVAFLRCLDLVCEDSVGLPKLVFCNRGCPVVALLSGSLFRD